MTTTHPTSIPQSILQHFGSFLCNQNFTHFVTLAMNDYYSIDIVRDRVRELHGRLDRKLLGSKWNKKPREERTFFIGFHEHINTNHHVHLLMRIKPKYECNIDWIIGREWINLTRKGTSNVQEIQSNGCIPYSLKEQYKTENYESFILSTVFHSN